jgi:hypothetical protein
MLLHVWHKRCFVLRMPKERERALGRWDADSAWSGDLVVWPPWHSILRES